jgi:hypothetical protein
MRGRPEREMLAVMILGIDDHQIRVGIFVLEGP